MGNSATELLKAKARSATPTAMEEDFSEDAQAAGGDARLVARVARSGFGTLPVYKLTPSGVVRIAVAVQSINEVLSHPDYSAECQDCGRSNCMYYTQIKGEVSTDQCPGKPARQLRVCPVSSCRKRVYDPMPLGVFKVDEFDHSTRDDEGDPNIIRDEEYSNSTPATRTKAAMDLHVIANHPTEALQMGLSRPAELPRLQVVS